MRLDSLAVGVLFLRVDLVLGGLVWVDFWVGVCLVSGWVGCGCGVYV